jgi:nucleolar protein 14
LQVQAEEEAEPAKQPADGGAEDEDDLEVSSSSSDDDGNAPSDAATARRVQRAAGNDPLQQNLRALSAKLLLKRGEKPSKQSMRELQADADESEDDEESDASEPGPATAGTADGAGGDADPDTEIQAAGPTTAGLAGMRSEATFKTAQSDLVSTSDSDGSMDSAEAAEIAEHLDAAERILLQGGGARVNGNGRAATNGTAGTSNGQDGSDEEAEDDDGILALLRQAIAAKQEQQAAQAAAAPGAAASSAPGHDRHDDSAEAHVAPRAGTAAPSSATAHAGEAADDVTFTPPLPSKHCHLRKLLAGRSGEGVAKILQRIRRYHTAELNRDSKVKLQSFYGLVVQHFAAVAGEQPLQRRVLDALGAELADMTAAVPLFAASLARARLGAMHEQFASSLGSAECACRTSHPLRCVREPSSCLHVCSWPPPVCEA